MVLISCKCFLQTLRTDGGTEFIFAKLRDFYKKRGIAIKYAELYIYKKKTDKTRIKINSDNKRLDVNQ